MAQSQEGIFTLVKVKGLKPRVDVFTKKLHANMTRLWKDATREFLAVIIKDDKIAIDTGMSRASLIPLSRLVKMTTEVRAYAAQGRKHASRKGFTSIDGTYDPGTNRTAALGEKLGQLPAFRLNFGTPGRPVFRFEFNINVYQYALHEPQWQSLAHGQEAFLAYLRANAVNYVPKLADWILPETQG